MPTRVGSKSSMPRVGPRLLRRGDREEDVAIHPPHLLDRADRLRVEALHLGGDPHRVVGRVERLDPADAAAAGDGGLPGRRRIEAERRDRSETGDRNPSHGAERLVIAPGAVSAVRPATRPVGRRAPPVRARRTCTVPPMARPRRARSGEPVERPDGLDALVPFPPMEADARPRAARRPPGWQYEPKWDGFRGLLENAAGELRLWSRNGRPLLRYFPELEPLGRALPAALVPRRRDRDRARRRARLRRDADAPPPGREPDPPAGGRDPRLVRRVRPARLGRRPPRASARSRSDGARSSSRQPRSRSRRRRPTAARRSPGSTRSRRSGSTA